MGIKKDHTHGGKVCYVVRSHHPLKDQQVVFIGDKEFALAYMIYTGQWCLYDTETGREVASFGREFYESFMGLVSRRLHAFSGPLVPDPECLVRR